MPYLSCPNCRLTVYNPPTVVEPERCPRCGVPLSSGATSLFPPRSPLRPDDDGVRRPD
jgi:hypothetical protein